MDVRKLYEYGYRMARECDAYTLINATWTLADAGALPDAAAVRRALVLGAKSLTLRQEVRDPLEYRVGSSNRAARLGVQMCYGFGHEDDADNGAFFIKRDGTEVKFKWPRDPREPAF